MRTITTLFSHYSMVSETNVPVRHSCSAPSKLVNKMHDVRQTDILVMDFRQAFDKVCHRLVVTKLMRNGKDIHGKDIR